jgi:exonuclease III
MEDFTTPPSPVDRLSGKKTNKEILELNNTIVQMVLTDIYRVFHPAAAQYTFFSAAHGTFSKIDLSLDTKKILANMRKLK